MVVRFGERQRVGSLLSPAVDEATRRVVGVWRVTGYDDRPSTESPWSTSYGDDVDGLIVYDESGWLSVQITGAGRFDSYFGRFTLLEATVTDESVVGRVNHELIASSMPELLDLDQSRPFRVTGNTLVLGDELTWRRVAIRVSP